MPTTLPRHLLAAVVFFVMMAVCAQAQSLTPAPLTPAEAFRINEDSLDLGEISWVIAPGYYMYRDKFAATDADGSVLEVISPEGKMVSDFTFGDVEVYEDLAQITFPAASGDVVVTSQGCQVDGICYAPVTQTITFPERDVPASPSPDDAETAFAHHPAWILITYAGLGLLLGLTPCVFPMFPILLGMLSRQGEALSMRRGATLSGVYVLAMASAFALLGAFAGWSGQNLMIMMQSPWVIGTVAVIFAALAASSLGLFEIRMPDSVNTRISQVQGRKGSLSGAAVLGFGSALIVGPCVTAPLAGALLYIGQTGDIALGAAALFALGVGQGTPLFLAGTFGAAVLPRSGAWMHAVKPIFGVIFAGMAIWIASRIIPGPLSLLAWSVLLLTLSVHLGLLRAQASTLRRSAALILSVLGVIQAVGAATGGHEPLRPLHMLVDTQRSQDALVFTTAETLADIPNQGAALIYFTADWCIVCDEIEVSVFSDPEVMTVLSGRALIKVDLTRVQPNTTAIMRDLDVVGPPTIIVRNAQGAETQRFIGQVSAHDMINALR